MKDKYIKLCFGGTYWVTKLSDIQIECPNRYGGIGSISSIPLEPIWTGYVFVDTQKTRVLSHFSFLTMVQTADGYLCDDEGWETFWELEENPVFSYQYWINLAALINKLKKDVYGT